MDYLPHEKILQSVTLRELAPYSWWIQAAAVKIGSNASTKILLDVDKMCLILEQKDFNRKELNNKIRVFKALGKTNYYTENNKNYCSIKDLDNREQEQRRQVWDFINEIRACIWLFHNQFYNVKLIQKNKNKTPDISAEKSGQNWFIEVKTLHNPRDEENRLLQRDVSIRDVDQDYISGLVSKVEYFIADADLKFNDVVATNRLLIIFTTYSISAILKNRNISLNSCLCSIDNKGISVVEICN